MNSRSKFSFSSTEVIQNTKRDHKMGRKKLDVKDPTKNHEKTKKCTNRVLCYFSEKQSKCELNNVPYLFMIIIACIRFMNLLLCMMYRYD